ncbi:Bardet-Biedl syndrome 2 protein [Chamberlinius hualienensis]
MLMPLYTLNLGQHILPRQLTIGRYDGVNPCLTAATIGNKVLVHNPQQRTKLSITSSKSNYDVCLLNINQSVNALCAGAIDQSKPNNDVLFVGTSSSLLAYKVHDNTEQFYKEVSDGVNSLTFGRLGSNETPMVIVGGNCTIHGFDHKGRDPFWTVTGDNVTSLCLLDFNGDGKQELLVGSEDYNIRIFQDDDIIDEITETECVTNICRLRSGCFGYALANGTVGVYEKLHRNWRIKSKNQVISILGFDMNLDGVPELITGWSNGKIDVRNDRSGEVIFKDNFSNSIAGIVAEDYCLRGTQELICCSTDGEIKAYSPSAGEKKIHQIDLQAEQEAIRDLSQKKQALLLELKTYEDNNKLTKSTSLANHIIKSSNSQLGVIPADTQLKTELNLNEGSQNSKAYVELLVSTSNDTIIQAVMIFAEGIFDHESLVFHPTEQEVSSIARIPLHPPRDIALDLHIKVFVGYKGSSQFHVFELTRQLPRFAMYVLVPTKLTVKLQSYATFQIKERIQRVLIWLHQHFLSTEEVGIENGGMEVNFVALRTKQPLVISVDTSGQVTIGTNDMELAGIIIQSLSSFLNLDDANVLAEFPVEMEDLCQTLQQVEEYEKSRQTLMADMTNSSALVRSLIIRAEDARLMADFKMMQQWYSQLYSVNQELLQNYTIRSNNYEEMMKCLKHLNQIIQKAGQLRVGKSKTSLINACRVAIKNNDFTSLQKIIKSGVV